MINKGFKVALIPLEFIHHLNMTFLDSSYKEKPLTFVDTSLKDSNLLHNPKLKNRVHSV